MIDPVPAELTLQPDATPRKAIARTLIHRQSGRTRISGAWVGVIAGALVFTALLIFILQNIIRTVVVSYFTAIGSIPLGIALLLATLAALLMAGRDRRPTDLAATSSPDPARQIPRLAPVLDRSDVEREHGTG